MILFLLAMAVLAVLAIGILFGRLFSRLKASDCTVEWLEELSLDRYRPMERLLRETDFRFLEQQQGYCPSIAKQLRAARKRIFNDYLAQLIGDFRRLVRIARLMMVYSPTDRPDLARAIGRLQREFYWNVFCAELSLVLPLPSSPVRVARLIGALDTIRQSALATSPLLEL